MNKQSSVLNTWNPLSAVRDLGRSISAYWQKPAAPMPKTDDVEAFLKARGGQLPGHGIVDALQSLVKKCQNVKSERRANKDDEACQHSGLLVYFKHLEGTINHMDLKQVSVVYVQAREFIAESDPEDCLGQVNHRHEAALAFIDAVHQYVTAETIT